MKIKIKACSIKILLDSSTYASVVCKDVLYKRHKIFKEPPNFTAKEFFVIKESRPVRNTTKRIKQI